MKHPEGIPAGAEQVEHAAVYRTIERESRFLPGMKALALVVECPRCHAVHEDPGVLRTVECDCGICIRYDFGTWVWDNAKETTNAA